MASKSKQAVITKVKTGKLKGEYRFMLKSRNGKIVAQSYPETYKKKADCVKTLRECFADFEIVVKL